MRLFFLASAKKDNSGKKKKAGFHAKKRLFVKIAFDFYDANDAGRYLVDLLIS
jgi:hypothetical protein